ncbi:MAG: hypothetical protein K5840_00685, partial [Eubacterium sp.]|nr:hypothetical protein [Eubacterium sp.]
AFSVVITVFCTPLSGFIASALTGDSVVEGMVRDYTVVTLAGTLPKILVYIPFWFLRLDGRNKAVTVMMTIMGAGNVVLDLLFLFVLNMGVFGAALASVIATALACVYGFMRLHSKGGTFRLEFSKPDREILQRISVAGSPAASNNFLQSVRLLLINGLLLSSGGNILVAEFTVINAIYAFAESVTVGVPQAGAAMLGVYHGERDGDSIKILMEKQWKYGVVLAAVFGVLIVVGADFLSFAYALNVPLRPAMICLGLSLFPGLLCGILQTYYGVAEQIKLSHMIIVCRVLIFAVPTLALCLRLGITPWVFLIATEVLTLITWWVVTRLAYKGVGKSRYLFIGDSDVEDVRALNFSVSGDTEDICNASEKISEYCAENGVDMKQTMKISLVVEEMMTLIASLSGTDDIHFDVRVFHMQDVTGLRIRYGGKLFDPLTFENEDLEFQIMMLRGISEVLEYSNVFGMNNLMILL